MPVIAPRVHQASRVAVNAFKGNHESTPSFRKAALKATIPRSQKPNALLRFWWCACFFLFANFGGPEPRDA
jgi:hypothetical protein